MIEASSTGEQMPYGEVYSKDGTSFMRPDRSSQGAVIPADMAKAMSMLINRSGRQTTERTSEAFKKIAINCHRATFYVMGLISMKALVRMGDLGRFVMFPKESFKPSSSFDNMNARLLNTVANKEVGLGQIKGFMNRNVADHSFLFASDESGKIVCFEKVDREDGPYRIVQFDEIYKNWGQYKMLDWAAGTVDQVKGSPEAQTLRAYVDERLNEIVASSQKAAQETPTSEPQ